MIGFVLCAMMLLVLPLQADAYFCTHPDLLKPEVDYHHGYDCRVETHREWMQKIWGECAICGEEVLGNKEYISDWEEHDFWVDWDNPDPISDTLTYYYGYCKDCDYEETFTKP